jgi:hypothetical protein
MGAEVIIISCPTWSISLSKLSTQSFHFVKAEHFYFTAVEVVVMSSDSKPDKLFRVTVFFKRKPGMTEEEFNYRVSTTD